MPTRPPLTPERIVQAAVGVADDGGIAAVSMRTVAKALDVEAMSLYHHVEGKDALLDALADWVFGRIDRPEPSRDWRAAMVDRARSARRALSSHPWALGLIESRRSPGPNLLAHHESVLANLRANGFSATLAAHAFSALDAYVYGFVLTEVNLPFEPGGDAEQFVDDIAHLLPVEQYPHMVELIAQQVAGGGYRYGDEFDFGLDLVLDGLERHLSAQPTAHGGG